MLFLPILIQIYALSLFDFFAITTLMQATTLRAARAANTTVVSPVVGLSVGAVVVVLSVACFFLFYNDKSYYSYYNSCSNSNDNYDQGRVA